MNDTATSTASAYDARACFLGEGAFWHPQRRQFFWFDIIGKRLMSRDISGAREWQFAEMASAAGWIDANRLLIATETGLSVLDLRDTSPTPLTPLEAASPGTRSNDGRADRQGGFWIGTMGKQAEARAGAIYRWYRGELRKLVDAVTIPNAICFSADGRLAHYADTRESRVWTQPLDAEGWPEGERRPYLDLALRGLNPDGAVIDASGAFCVACWGDGAVRRFDPQGHELDRIAVGGLHASCPAIGGSDMQDLLVTTARQGMTDPDPAQGLPYLTRAPAPGLPEPKVIL